MSRHTWLIRRMASQGGNRAGPTELQNLSRFSTESQQRNGFRQSRLPDRGNRILEDMQNGNYSCLICMEDIRVETTHAYDLWHCDDCHVVSHQSCVNLWFQNQNPRRSLHEDTLRAAWNCPHCFLEQPGYPKATCWCSKTFNPSPSNIPNSCLGRCERAGTCIHGGEERLCQKTCHPGPCNIPCTYLCGRKPASPPEPPNCWKRFSSRFFSRERGTLREIISLSGFLIIFLGLLGVGCSYHVDWWSKPYKYPNFHRSSELELVIIVFLGIFLYTPVMFGTLLLLATVVSTFLRKILNLESTSSKPKRKCLTRMLGTMLLIVTCLGIFVLPIVGFAGGPDIAWYYQMKNSCQNLDTRIRMDAHRAYGQTDGSTTVPTTKFNLHSRSSDVKDHTLYLGSRSAHVINNSKPFRYYHRLSGSTMKASSFAIDIDTHNHVWRLMALNDSDVTNAWLAYGSNQRTSSGFFSHLPESPPLAEIQLHNGTFTQVTEDNPHMHLPELDIAISNMYPFISNCRQEPFLRVFELPFQGRLEDEKIKTALERPWSPKSGGGEWYSDREFKDGELPVRMRTASFGHGRQALDMCIQESYELDGQGEGWRRREGRLVRSLGVTEYHLVPFAIIAAYRETVYATDLRGFEC